MRSKADEMASLIALIAE